MLYGRKCLTKIMTLSRVYYTCLETVKFVRGLRLARIFTLILLTWSIGWAPKIARKWQMGFNSAFKVLISSGVKLSGPGSLAILVQHLDEHTSGFLTSLRKKKSKADKWKKKNKSEVHGVSDVAEFYVWVSVHHKLIYITNQRDATWQYVY